MHFFILSIINLTLINYIYNYIYNYIIIFINYIIIFNSLTILFNSLTKKFSLALQWKLRQWSTLQGEWNWEEHDIWRQNLTSKGDPRTDRINNL